LGSLPRGKRKKPRFPAGLFPGVVLRGVAGSDDIEQVKQDNHRYRHAKKPEQASSHGYLSLYPSHQEQDEQDHQYETENA
jgi:hypothetical protein